MSEKGHPRGLFPLFFTEMWERLAFYLMLGILVLYTTDSERGGLGMPLGRATEIYGTYMAFVYFTPFLGGMIADRLLGFRRSVFLGGLLMACGFFLLSVRSVTTLFAGLTLLCLGNGLFKPNISAMVGNLYEPGDPKRDAGFNIFYMGINIGASLSALLSAPLRNLFSFNAAFASAGVGLLIGVGILSLNWRKLERADRRSAPDPDDITFVQVLVRILLPAAVFGAAGWVLGGRIPFVRDSIGATTFAFLAGMVPIMAYFVALWLRAKPQEKPGLGALIPVFVAGGTFFMILHLSGGLMTIYAENDTDRHVPALAVGPYAQQAMPGYFGNANAETPRPDPRTLVPSSREVEAMFGARRVSESAMAQLSGVPGLRVAPATDPAVRPEWSFLTAGVFRDDDVAIKPDTDARGDTVLSVSTPETVAPLREVVFLTEVEGRPVPALLTSPATQARVYAQAGPSRLAPGEFLKLVNAEMITALFNPVFVVVLTPVVVWVFGRFAARGRPVSTARKIFIGLVLTTVALLIMAAAARSGLDGAVKVSALWLVIYYMVITFGELCLSPMGLSLVTKLSPKRYVGLMMGGWFLATAVGNKLSGFISGLPPTTVMFLVLAGATLLVAAFIFVLLPKLDAAIRKYQA